MNILRTIQDANLFRPFLADGKDNLRSWTNWSVALRCLYGLKLKPQHEELIAECTGRTINSMPSTGFQQALFLTGRRSGKSRISAIIGAYESCLSGRDKTLAAGELGLVSVISPSKKQSRIVKTYLRAIFSQTPLLRAQITRETQEGFDLQNGICIEILVGDWRTIRGYSLLCCIVDEVCFMGIDSDSAVKSDTELVRAIRPSLATTNGKMICISSPYAEKGWAYKTWKKDFGNNKGHTLVWRAASTVMNPTLDQSIIDRAMQEDSASAQSEFFAQFRTDIQTYLSRELVEQCVVKDRKELAPRSNIKYKAFVDVSGGRNDAAALAIGHRDDRNIIVDFLIQYKPPFSPYTIAGIMSGHLRRFGCKLVTGDRFAAEYTSQAFMNHHIKYIPAEYSKSELYLNFIGPICSMEIKLVDNETLVTQICNLERRTRSGGRDSIDHPSGLNYHDDLSNVVAGLANSLGRARVMAGGWNLNRATPKLNVQSDTDIKLTRKIMQRAIQQQQHSRM